MCAFLFIIYYGYYILRNLKRYLIRVVDSLISKFGILERNGCKGYFRKFTALIHLALANLYIFLRFILKLWP
ncbi:MAG: hypothetical protein DRN49_04355 [Thaumarchaeota archaeon]|nr:MAG: hypothetical protein DRN49_04355 [Nitrososphaerota archaeon]